MKSEAMGEPLASTVNSKQPLPAVRGARRFFWLNVSSNVTFALAQAAVGLWLTPYLIGLLGIAAYGMMPLVTSFISYLAIFTYAFTSSTSRFLTIDLGQGNTDRALRTFNTALFSVAGVCLGLLPFAVGGSLIFPDVLDVPLGWESDTSFLFLNIIMAFFLTALSSVFAISSFAHNRFFMGSAFDFAALIIRITFIVVVFNLFTPRLWYAGAAVLIASLVKLIGDIFLWRKLTPELGIKITAFDHTHLGGLMGLGGWVLVNQFGGLLLSDGSSLIIVNLALGAEATGGYGLMLQISAMIQGLIGTASTVVRPVILNKYAQADYPGLLRLSNQAVKLLGISLALPIGLLCGFSGPFLSLWIGPHFKELGILLALVIGHLGINLSTRPLQYTLNAYNRVKWPGIVTLIAGAIEMVMVAIVAFWGEWGMPGVAAVTAMFWIAKNALFIPWYTARVMHVPWWRCFTGLGGGLLGTLFVGFVAYALSRASMPDSWLSLISYAAIVSVFYAGIVWMFGLNSLDKQLVKSLIPWRALRQDCFENSH